MRLTAPLFVVPRFHFWKDFGAGKKRKITIHRYWRNTMRLKFNRQKIEDHTLKPSELPAGARVFEADDFMMGHPDLMPDEIKKLQHQKVVYDHPWPFNVQIDPINNQEPQHYYNIDTRFFVPRDDALALTNTIVVNDNIQACPPLEPTEEHVTLAQRAFDWSTRGDSSMIRLPKKREWPRIDQVPIAQYGLLKERKEIHVINSLMDLSQTILAQHYHDMNDKQNLDELLQKRMVNYPRCFAPFQREDRMLLLDLTIDSMSLAKKPLELLESNPEKTKELDAVDIKPRTWKSVLERTRKYTPHWTFTLPQGAFPHTIQLASRIVRDYRNPDEMFARSLVHAFGLTSQFARISQLSQADNVSTPEPIKSESDEESKPTRDRIIQKSLVLEDPLNEDDKVSMVNSLELLPNPVVAQVIGLDLTQGDFHFTRYQLNTINFDDSNPRRVKNQAWYSGPVSMDDLQEVLRYYLDFQLSSMTPSMRNALKPQENIDSESSQSATV